MYPYGLLLNISGKDFFISESIINIKGIYDYKHDTFNLDKLNEYNKIIENSSKYLLNLLKDDGIFDYGYYAKRNGYVIDGYNIVRHAGALWSLVLTGSEDYKEKIVKGINYLINANYETYHCHWTSYAVNELLKYESDVKYYEFGLKILKVL